MKSLKIIFCALLLIALPLVAMELPKGTKKRAAEEIEEEKPAKVQAIESEQEQEIGKALEKEYARIAQEEKIEKEWQKKSAFERLPPEIQTHIISFLTTAKGVNRDARLQAAAQNIRNFILTSKTFQALLDDEKVAEYLITELAKNYIAQNPKKVNPADLVKAALALQTAGAGNWLLSTYKMTASRLIVNSLFSAADSNDLNRVSFILRYIPALLNATDNKREDEYEGWNLLQRAANQGQADIIDLVLRAYATNKQPVPLMALTPGGSNLLSLAASSGNLAAFDRIYNLLPVEKRIESLTLANSSGNTGLHYAAQNGHLAMVDRILNEPGTQALVNTANEDGDTPLFMAVEQNYSAIVTRLLQVPGIDVNIQDNAGRTPLIMAILNSSPEIVKALLKKQGFGGAESLNINLRNNYGLTALDLAKSLVPSQEDTGQRDAIIKMLIEHGAK